MSCSACNRERRGAACRDGVCDNGGGRGSEAVVVQVAGVVIDSVAGAGREG